MFDLRAVTGKHYERKCHEILVYMVILLLLVLPCRVLGSNDLIRSSCANLLYVVTL